MISQQLVLPDRKARMERAKELWRTSPGSANQKMTDSLLSDVLRLALDDFATNYKCMRGHTLDPAYWAAIQNDILIVIEAVARASVRPCTCHPDDAMTPCAQQFSASECRDGTGRDPSPPLTASQASGTTKTQSKPEGEGHE